MAEWPAQEARDVERDHEQDQSHDAGRTQHKRVSLVVMAAFLERNGVELTATNAEALSIMRSLAAGEKAEQQFTAWIDAHSHAP